MADARLKISVDGGGDIRRALGQIAAETRRANATMNAEARQAARTRAQIAAQEAREKTRAEWEAAREKARAAKEAEKAARDAAKTDAKLAKETAKAKAELERAITADKKREIRERIKSLEEESRAATREANKAERERIKAERNATRVAEREARARSRLGVAIGRGISASGAAAFGFGANVHSMIQSVRGTRAAAEFNVTQAISQAGGDRTERDAMLNRLLQVRGIPLDQLSGALAGAQSFAAVLGERGRSNAGTRASALEGFIQDAEFARDTFQDVGQVTQLSGMLQGQGVNKNTRQAILRQLTGMAFAGSVELGSVTREALGSITARVGQGLAALPGNASADQRQAAVRNAVVQSMAEIEVAKSLGTGPRQAGNVMASLNTALTGDRTQAAMLNNIRHMSDRGAAHRIESALYDSHGRLKTTDALGVISALGGAGVTAAQAQNIFAGGGHGNHQGLQANWRRLVGSMLGADAEGVRGYDRVRRLMDPSVAVTDEDLARNRDMALNGDHADVIENERAQVDALGKNTDAVTQMSNRFADWMARNPIAGAGLSAGAGLLGSAGSSLAGAAGKGIVSLFGSGAAGYAGGARAVMGSAGVLAGIGRVAAAGIGGAIVGEGINRIANGISYDVIGNRRGTKDDFSIFNKATWREAFGGTRGVEDGHATQAGTNALVQAMRQAVREGAREGIQAANISATVSPHDAVHAATEAATARAMNYRVAGPGET